MRPVALFYLLAFALSWLGFVPAFAAAHGVASFQRAGWQAALLLPALGPALAAGLVAHRYPLRGHARGLRDSFLRPVPLGWWLLAAALAVGIMVAASLLSSLPGRVGVPAHPSAGSVLTFAALSLFANPCEEIGWRGFAQGRLQRLCTPLLAACVVGSLWAIWHLPLFFLRTGAMTMAHTPFWPWAAGVVPQAILLAWLRNRTGHSLAIVSVFHVLGNVVGFVLAPAAAATSAVSLLVALLVVLATGSRLGEPQHPPHRQPAL